MAEKKTLREKFDFAVKFLADIGHGEDGVSIDLYGYKAPSVHLMRDMRDEKLRLAILERLGAPKLRVLNGVVWADWKTPEIEVTTGGWPASVQFVEAPAGAEAGK